MASGTSGVGYGETLKPTKLNAPINATAENTDQRRENYASTSFSCAPTCQQLDPFHCLTLLCQINDDTLLCH